jgi:hypothetical protein
MALELEENQESVCMQDLPGTRMQKIHKRGAPFPGPFVVKNGVEEILKYFSTLYLINTSIHSFGLHKDDTSGLGHSAHPWQLLIHGATM